MEPVTALVLSVLVPLLGVLIGLASRPTQCFRFEHEGRRYEVHNYLFREALLVDGEVVRHTRVGGDHVSHADHAVLLPDGRQLEVGLSLAAAGVQCRARIGDQVVFDSTRAQPRLITCTPSDARWDAVQVLLAEIEAAPDLRTAATTLRTELLYAFQRLEQAGRVADAHRVLGGTEADAAALIARRQGAVDDLLALLRQLHLASCAREIADLDVPPVLDTLRRLEAEREVLRLS